VIPKLSSWDFEVPGPGKRRLTIRAGPQEARDREVFGGTIIVGIFCAYERHDNMATNEGSQGITEAKFVQLGANLLFICFPAVPRMHSSIMHS
jgi:hypothetical protein